MYRARSTVYDAIADSSLCMVSRFEMTESQCTYLRQYRRRRRVACKKQEYPIVARGPRREHWKEEGAEAASWSKKKKTHWEFRRREGP
jgi:hypothetical protein